MKNKTRSVILLIGGIVQVLMVILHIAIFWGISSNSLLAPAAKITAHIFNAAVLTTVIFLAYVSLFRIKDLINSSIGNIICIFAAVFYLQRGFVELYLRGINFFNLSLSIGIAILYIIPILPSKKKEPAKLPVEVEQ